MVIFKKFMFFLFVFKYITYISTNTHPYNLLDSNKMSHQANNLMNKSGSPDRFEDVFNHVNFNDYVNKQPDLGKANKAKYCEMSKSVYVKPEYVCRDVNESNAQLTNVPSCFNKSNGKRKIFNGMNETTKVNKNSKNNYFSVVINQVHPYTLQIDNSENSNANYMVDSMNCKEDLNGAKNQEERVMPDSNDSSSSEKSMWGKFTVSPEQNDIEYVQRNMYGRDTCDLSNKLKQEGLFGNLASRPMRERFGSNESDLKRSPLPSNCIYAPNQDRMNKSTIDFKKDSLNGWDRSRNFPNSSYSSTRLSHDVHSGSPFNSNMNVSPSSTINNNLNWNDLRRDRTLGHCEVPFTMDSYKRNKNGEMFLSSPPVFNTRNWMTDMGNQPMINRGYMNNSMSPSNRYDDFRKCNNLTEPKLHYELKDHRVVEKQMNQENENIIKLFFGNLAPITTEKDMYDLLSPFGRCSSLIILKDRRGKSRGSGFVTFYNKEEAINVIKYLNNKITLNGAHKALEIRFPEDKTEKQLRIKVLTEARIQGEKIAPSGCLPIKTEDVLTKKINKAYALPPWRNMNDMESNHLNTSFNTEYGRMNSHSLKKPMLEPYRTTSITSTETPPTTNYYNKMEENETATKYFDSSSKGVLQNPYSELNTKGGYSGNLENDILLPKFLIDETRDAKNILAETVSSFKDRNTQIENRTPLYNAEVEINPGVYIKNDGSEIKSNVLIDDDGNLDRFIEENLERKVTYTSNEDYLFPNFSSNHQNPMNHTYGIFNEYLGSSSNVKEPQEKMNDYNMFKMDNRMNTLYNASKMEGSDSSTPNITENNSNLKYSNHNVYQMGFDLSHFFVKNKDGLLDDADNNKSSYRKVIEEMCKHDKNELEARLESSNENRNTSNVDSPNWQEYQTMQDKKQESDHDISKGGNGTTENNNNDANCKMLQNIMKLYTKNKPLISSTQMHSYLCNVLSEINNSLEIFDECNVKNVLQGRNSNEEIEPSQAI